MNFNNNEKYEIKIKKLMEESRFLREKQTDLSSKLNSEEKNLKLIEEKQYNLETSRNNMYKKLNEKRKIKIITTEDEDLLNVDDMTISELINRISKLENSV